MEEETRTTKTMEQAVSWLGLKDPVDKKAFSVLMLGALTGTLGVLPYVASIITARGPLPMPVPVILLLQSVQGLVLSAVAVLIGLRLGERAGLGIPLLRSWLAGEPGVPARARSVLPSAAIVGAVMAAAIALIDQFIFMPRLPERLREMARTELPPWKGFLASFYGGIVEELLLRLGVMTLFTWIGMKVTRAEPGEGRVIWPANLLASLLFGLGHLPATAAIVPLSPLVVGRGLLLNGLMGTLFGWLYWRRGLSSGIAAHLSGDIVIHVLAPVIFRRR